MHEPHKMQFRPDIQGLRAIAIMIVVLAHAGIPGFSGGFVGVDVFFVLSGFLITGMLVEEHFARGSIRYGAFLVRRLRRLLPALLVMAVSVYFLATALLSSYEFKMQTGSFLYSVSWTSNFYFAFAEFDYFSALQAKDLFLHTWSLGIEEQFYILWPWLIMLGLALSARGQLDHGRLQAILVLNIAVFVTSLGLCVYWSGSGHLLSFYMTPARGWQFALGSLVYVMTRPGRSSKMTTAGHSASPSARTAAGVIGLLLITASATLLHGDLNYPGLYAVLPSSGAALVIYSGTGHGHSPIARLLSSRPFVWIGDRSYSLYLWHWPVLMLGGAFGAGNDGFSAVSMIAMSLLLASASFRWIELPFWKGRFRQLRPRLVTLSAVLAIVASSGLASVGSRGFLGSPDSAGATVASAIGTDRAEFFVARHGCDSWYHSAEVAPCETGNSSAEHTIALIGDSIGTQWASVLPEIYQEPQWRIIVLAKSACTIADLEYYYQPAGGTYDVCTDWRNSSIDYLAELQPDIVFIGSSATSKFSESEWIGGTRRVVARLAPAVDHVVLIPGTPALSFDGPSCLQEPYRFTSRLRDSLHLCEEAQSSERSDQVAGYLERAAGEFANAQVLNLNDLVCPNRRCAARSPSGIPVFRDNQHLTARFVAAQSHEVSSRLDALGLGPLAFNSRLSIALTGR